MESYMRRDTAVDEEEEYSSLDITKEILFNKWLKNIFKFNTTSDINRQLNLTQIDELRQIFNRLLNSSDLTNYPELLRERYLKNTLILIFYTLIIIFSLFGNLLVCKVILSKRLGLRFRTTNMLIINLTISDLLMTIFTIPVSIARLILDDWPFGSSLCILAPFIQVTSVYVSTLSMTIIALDRYQVLINPLKARLHHKIPKPAIIALIWICAGILALPHSIFNRSVELFAYRTIYRCRTVYPEPKIFYRKFLTILTLMTQYLLPLTVTLATYALISVKIYRKVTIGEMTEQQLIQRLQSKRTTIKMLMTVCLVFAICWLPINLYHLLNDFYYFAAAAPVGMNTYLICHWLAFSSVCWNPFIYFGLNQYYREGLRKIFNFNNCSDNHNRNNTNQNSLALNTRSTVLLSRTNSRTSDPKLNFMSSLAKPNCKNAKNFVDNNSSVNKTIDNNNSLQNSTKIADNNNSNNMCLNNGSNNKCIINCGLNSLNAKKGVVCNGPELNRINQCVNSNSIEHLQLNRI